MLPISLTFAASNAANITSAESGDHLLPPIQPPPAAPTADRPYIRTVFHPSSGRDPLIQYYDDLGSAESIPSREALWTNPVAPFRSLADFTFARYAVNERLSSRGIDKLLCEIDSGLWFSGGSNISFKNSRDVYRSLDQASVQFQQVRLGTIAIS